MKGTKGGRVAKAAKYAKTAVVAGMKLYKKYKAGKQVKRNQRKKYNKSKKVGHTSSAVEEQQVHNNEECKSIYLKRGKGHRSIKLEQNATYMENSSGRFPGSEGFQFVSTTNT